MNNYENDAGVGCVDVAVGASDDLGSRGYSSWISSNVPLLSLLSLLLKIVMKAAMAVWEGVTTVPQAEQVLQGLRLVLT